MKKICLYISSLLILPLTSQAQQWTSHTNFNHVSQLAFQPGGHIIWGATPGGIFSFSSTDTVLIQHYTNVDGLPYIEASSVTLDQHHHKWIGTLGGGLAKLDSAGNAWTVFTRNDGLASDTVLCTAAGGQNVFAGGYGSLSYYDGYNWFSLLAQQGYELGNRTQALAARDDSLWIATDQGLRIVKVSPLSSIRDTNNWTTFSNYDGLSSDVRCILLTDTLSMIGAANGAARLVGGAWQRIPGLGDQVRSLARMGDSLFLATNNGVKLWHQNVLSDISPGLLSYNVLSLTVDEGQILWAGCDQGLCRYDAGSWDNYVFPGIAKNYVQHVSVSKTKTVWTTDGNTLISNYKNNSWSAFTNPIPGIPLTALTVDQDNNAWIGLGWWDGLNNSYLLKYCPDSLVNIFSTPRVPAGCGVWTGMVDRDNTKYFTAYNFAIFSVSPDDSVWTSYVDPSPRGAYNNAMWIISIAKDLSGGLWLGSYYNDLTYFKPQENTWEHFGVESGIPDVNIRQIAVDNSNIIWLATGNGLCRSEYDPVAHTLRSTVFQTSSSPILGNDIRSIVIDRSDNKWIGTERGLSLLTWDGKWVNYDRRFSPLISNDIRQLAVCPHDRSGDDIYIATAQGLSVLRYDAVAQRPVDNPSVAPNPFNMTRDGHIYFSNLPSEARIDIYTLDGRPSGTFYGPPPPPNPQTRGRIRVFPRRPAAGLYLCRISSSGQKPVICKLVMIR